MQLIADPVTCAYPDAKLLACVVWDQYLDMAPVFLLPFLYLRDHIGDASMFGRQTEGLKDSLQGGDGNEVVRLVHSDHEVVTLYVREKAITKAMLQ